MRADRNLRLNLRRVELASIALIFDAAVEGVFSYFRHNVGIGIVAFVAIVTGAVFFWLARHGQREDEVRLVRLPETFVVIALLLSQVAGYFISLDGRIPTGYAMVYLAAAVFFLIPPRLFACMGAGTFTVFVIWVISLDATLLDKAVAIFNTGLAIIAGIFGRRGLNRMQETEQRQRMRIATQNVTLAQVNESLARTNAEMNGLMAVAAHDLRSPLFGLRSLLDLAASRPEVSMHDLRDVLREASSSIGAMLALVGRLLEAHESECRPLRLGDRVNLREVLERARNRHVASAASHGLSLIVEAPEPTASVMADLDALDRILDNLVSNAIRFSPAGTTVRLTAGWGQGPYVEVVDEGVGVPAEERGALFSKFGRGATPPLNGLRGSGLGLYIVRTLAHSMKAQVIYRPAVGGGSAFRLAFRLDSSCL